MGAALGELEATIERNGRKAILEAWDSIRRSPDPYDGPTREILEMALDGKLTRLPHLAEVKWEM